MVDNISMNELDSLYMLLCIIGNLTDKNLDKFLANCKTSLVKYQ